MSDYVDVFVDGSLRDILELHRRILPNWSAADAERQETAARFVAGVLLERARGSARSYSQGWFDRRSRRWLLRHAKRKFGLSKAACANIRAVFAQNLGRAVHDLYLHRADLQREYPLALLPVGQKRFVEWRVGSTFFYGILKLSERSPGDDGESCPERLLECQSKARLPNTSANLPICFIAVA